MKTEISCDQCGINFLKDIKQVNENKKLKHRNFCSPQCLAASRVQAACVPCGNCGKEVMVSPSVRSRSRSGNNFCSRSCAASYNNRVYKTGKNHPNYTTGIGSYRQRALLAHNAKCSVCGYEVTTVLEVHHRDGNRKNNEIGNLDMLCPTHHKEYERGIRTYDLRPDQSRDS